MAHMYPVGGPTKPTYSPAERSVYEKLARALDDNYYVIHSTRWNYREAGERLQEGEVDFILVHPDHGIILFEVKGGQQIDYDGSSKIWRSTNDAGDVNVIRDPFEQVRNSVHHIKKVLKRRAATKQYTDYYYLNHAVWFPGITWEPEKYQLPHVDHNIVLDSSAIKEPEKAIARLFAYVYQRPIPPDAMKALLRVLAPTDSTKAKLRDQFNDEDAAFIQLQNSQYRTLDMMKHHPRVTVRGAAGTGKTVIALERARQFPQVRMHPFPGPITTKLPKVVIHRGPWTVVTRQVTPGTARTHQVK